MVTFPRNEGDFIMKSGYFLAIATAFTVGFSTTLVEAKVCTVDFFHAQSNASKKADNTRAKLRNRAIAHWEAKVKDATGPKWAHWPDAVDKSHTCWKVGPWWHCQAKARACKD